MIAIIIITACINYVIVERFDDILPVYVYTNLTYDLQDGAYSYNFVYMFLTNRNINSYYYLLPQHGQLPF